VRKLHLRELSRFEVDNAGMICRIETMLLLFVRKENSWVGLDSRGNAVKRRDQVLRQSLVSGQIGKVR
jgi:hypothetical protein